MELAPILLFAFNRPEHIKKALESLASNAQAKESELHVFIDGPKEKNDIGKIEEVKSVVQSRPWCKRVHVYASARNCGVPAQVIGSVSKFCEKYGKVIVLEDDLILSPFFLDYMNKALNVYADQERVMEVTGYMFPVNGLNTATGFMRGNCGWGWGTWDRAWKNFEPDGNKLLSQLNDKRVRYEFDFKGSYGYHKLLKSQVKGKIGGWDIRWYASIFLNNGLTLFPGKSLVKNIGFDGSGTNIPNTKYFDTDMANNPVTDFSDEIGETGEMISATIDFFRSQKTLKVYWEKIIARIKRKTRIL